jgi:hypothetical protein
MRRALVVPDPYLPDSGTGSWKMPLYFQFLLGLEKAKVNLSVSVRTSHETRV